MNARVAGWLTSSFRRNYPGSVSRAGTLPCVDIALNEQFSFQAAVRKEGTTPEKVKVEALAPEGWTARVRRVGYVPMGHYNTPLEEPGPDCEGLGHVPGFVPDPLVDENTMLLPAGETHAFWITVRAGEGARPGAYRVRVRIVPESGRKIDLTARVRLHDVAIEPRKGFAITHWFYVDSLMDWYKTDLFDRRFWEILARYVRNVAEHGQDTLYVPVFTPPLDGVKRPSQLLRVARSGRGAYRFDWQDVRTYVRLAKRCGIRNFEWCHPFTQWGVKHAIRVYEGQGREERLLWAPGTGATSETYRRFLGQYLRGLGDFLDAEGIRKRSFFHVSDEPHGAEHLDNYRKARAMLKELAPWMMVMDALSDIEYARQGLTDMPVPSISKALDFVKEEIPCWCYYCCGPRGKYLNRLMDTPLAKIAMHGFLFYRWPFQGFLHWGYNYWYESQTRHMIDPYSVQDGLRWPGWAYGDPFVVYPGPEGPVDSIRWEVFGESLQDYRLLQTRRVDREDRLLTPIRSFAEFPKGEEWRRRARRELLEGGGHA